MKLNPTLTLILAFIFFMLVVMVRAYAEDDVVCGDAKVITHNLIAGDFVPIALFSEHDKENIMIFWGSTQHREWLLTLQDNGTGMCVVEQGNVWQLGGALSWANSFFPD